MEKALQMASDYHSATQEAHKVSSQQQLGQHDQEQAEIGCTSQGQAVLQLRRVSILLAAQSWNVRPASLWAFDCTTTTPGRWPCAESIPEIFLCCMSAWKRSGEQRADCTTVCVCVLMCCVCQAHQVPVHARVIAESATTNILTNLTLEQQMRLQQSEKRMEDMKAALHLACGVLRQTNYMDQHVRGIVGVCRTQKCSRCCCSTQGLLVVPHVHIHMVLVSRMLALWYEVPMPGGTGRPWKSKARYFVAGCCASVTFHVHPFMLNMYNHDVDSDAVLLLLHAECPAL